MEKRPGKKTGKGGAREGAGRKAVSGMYSNWLKSGKMEKGMARRTTPGQRIKTIWTIRKVFEYEIQSQELREQEEEDKRQLPLF